MSEIFDRWKKAQENDGGTEDLIKTKSIILKVKRVLSTLKHMLYNKYGKKIVGFRNIKVQNDYCSVDFYYDAKSYEKYFEFEPEDTDNYVNLRDIIDEILDSKKEFDFPKVEFDMIYPSKVESGEILEYEREVRFYKLENYFY